MLLFPSPYVAPVAGGGITYVGGKSATLSGAGATYTVALDSGWSGGSGGNPLEGDIVLIYSGWCSITDGTPGVSNAAANGWTETADQWINDTRDANGRFSYKIMTSTPDTSVDIIAANNSGHGNVCMIKVFRGVHQSTPMDVAVVTGSGNNAAIISSNPITPITAGVMLVTGGIATDDGTVNGVTTAPGSYTDLLNPSTAVTTYNANGAMAHWGGWTSGAHTPGAFTGNDSTSFDSSVRFLCALRPA